MDRHVFGFLMAVGAAGCAPSYTYRADNRPTTRSISSTPDLATLVVTDVSGYDSDIATEIYDDDATVVAELIPGEHAVLYVRPRTHVFGATLKDRTPGFAECVGAARADLAAGRTYALRVIRGQDRGVRAGRTGGLSTDRCKAMNVVAVPREDLDGWLRKLDPAKRREIGDGERASIDRSETITGMAKLRAAGDRPSDSDFGLDPSDQAFTAKNVLGADDGIPIGR